jgi:quercetin 2,3-dioxygenase
MSTTSVGARECSALGAAQLTLTAYPNREARLGAVRVSRALPIRDRRMIGPWCFLDRFGPLEFAGARPMNVPPHPHIGLQTVSWLLEGEVLHSDSLGAEAMARPGTVNVMTAGRGIAHAEESPVENSGRLNGVQLWVALPDVDRSVDPAFESVARVPVIEERGGVIQVFAGSYGDAASPAHHFSKLIGVDLQVHPGETLDLALDAGFEHAALALSGDCAIEDQLLQERTLYYLGTRRANISFSSHAGGRALLIGGPPFPETILMWWNFVARTPEEIAEARADWEAQRRFGEVVGEHAPRLAAPDLVRFARPNSMS